MSRQLDKMHPELKQRFDIWHEMVVQAKIPYLITCVDRNITEQMALYVQGRMLLIHVNRFRKSAGLYLFKSEKENQNEVTWTLASKHITYPDKGSVYSRAFDFVILKENRAEWNLKVDVNHDDRPDYIQLGEMWEDVGGQAGYRFGDYCHLEI